VDETYSPDDDEIWQEVAEIFDGRVGDELPADRKKEIFEEVGPGRYESRVPPGYKDANDNSKQGFHKFGDLILWFEIIEQAKATQKPVLFITDDRKEDWWDLSVKGFAPRPELGNEIYRAAGTLFHMYLPLDFVKWAGGKLDREISEKAAGEIEDLRPLDEGGANRFELGDRMDEL
jgi:hypothetical protein